MVKIIDVCSGKGGVGKTTVAANLGLALQRMGRRTVVVDCNLTTSHLSLCIGARSYGKTLNDFLRGDARAEEAVYHHPSGMRIVPASMELKDLVDVDAEGLRRRLLDAFRDADVVLLDSAPGVGKEALISMKASDSAVFVATPFIPSLVDVLKVHHLMRDLGSRPSPLGVVLNRVRFKRYEIPAAEVSQFVELPLLGVVPEDEAVLESANKRALVVQSSPFSESSVAIHEIASRLTGIPYRRPSRLKMFFERMKRAEGGPHTPGYIGQNGML